MELMRYESPSIVVNQRTALNDLPKASLDFRFELLLLSIVGGLFLVSKAFEKASEALIASVPVDDLTSNFWMFLM